MILLLKTWLITGGAGFIGSNFVRQCLAGEKALRIINLDKLIYAGNTESLATATSHPHYIFIHGDIADLSERGVFEIPKPYPDITLNKADKVKVSQQSRNLP